MRLPNLHVNEPYRPRLSIFSPRRKIELKTRILRKAFSVDSLRVNSCITEFRIQSRGGGLLLK